MSELMAVRFLSAGEKPSHMTDNGGGTSYAIEVDMYHYCVLTALGSSGRYRKSIVS